VDLKVEFHALETMAHLALLAPMVLDIGFIG